MYEDPRYIRQNVVKVSLNDEELEQLIGAVGGKQKATVAREILMFGVKHKLFEYGNLMRLEQILEDSKELQKVA